MADKHLVSRPSYLPLSNKVTAETQAVMVC